jgi:hypothetical protein
MGQVFHFAEFQYFDSSVARILFRSLFNFAFSGNSFSMAPNTRANPVGTGCSPFCAGFQNISFLESCNMKHLTLLMLSGLHTIPQFLRIGR